MKTEQLIREIKTNNVINEKHILLLRRRLNEGERIEINFWDNPIDITREQTEKGLNFLINQDKTPKGKIRQNSVFGFRERNILENFSHFTFSGFKNISKYGQIPNFAPVYNVHSKDGYSFQYYYDFVEVNIVG